MGEAQVVAEKLGIVFKLGIDKRIDGAAAIGEHKTSMLQDAEHGRPLELEGAGRQRRRAGAHHRHRGAVDPGDLPGDPAAGGDPARRTLTLAEPSRAAVADRTKLAGTAVAASMSEAT